MKLRFFIDDSGKNDPPVFVLGGAAFDMVKLRDFEADWRTVLASPPAIRFFKMKEANARRGAFKGMTADARDAKVAALGAVLRTHAVATISVIVKHDDYRKVYEGQMMRSMDRPYQMMFHLVMATAYKLCREQSLADTAEFVFDRQLEHEAALRESFPALKRDMVAEMTDFLAADPRHADDKDEVGLQAADMVAWHVRRSWRDGTDGLSRASSAGPAIVALPGKHDLLTETTLRYLAEIAMGTVRRLNTVFPCEADRMSEQFDILATIANFELMMAAQPFQTVELISFPATGTEKFQLVGSCAHFDRPHLHRRSENRCLGVASAA